MNVDIVGYGGGFLQLVLVEDREIDLGFNSLLSHNKLIIYIYLHHYIIVSTDKI